jgi:D-alanyl-D-alanine carboxypeptidase/D-alanyl-D-alanine-endopeptidase (penicillin-binding protein 4)
MRFTVAALAAGAISATAHSAPVAGAETPPALADEVREIIADAGFEGVVAVHAEQREPALEILALESDRSLIPASNNKLHVTAAALHFLGADHVATTRVLANGPVDESGHLRGDLIVVGGGDPTISGRFNDGNILAIFETWASTLREEHGIRAIEGRVIGDDDLFDDELIEETWFMGELGEWYSAENSALSFNDNCVDIHWVAGKAVGESPTFTTEPVTDHLEIVSEVATESEDADTDRYYHREFGSNRVVVTGGIPLGESKTDWASVHNPTLFTVSVLRDTLVREEIAVAGEPADIDDLSRAAVLHDLTELCVTTSPPLSEVIAVVNQNSQNLYADMVLKAIGWEVEREGSFDAGVRAVRHFLSDIGALPGGDTWQMVDGSGLSASNRTTPRTLVRLLRHMDTRPDASVFRASLPRGRADRGSLRRRFGHSERHRAVAGRILGKTGYIGGVWALSGIAENQARVEVYYSIILNGRPSESVPSLRLIDDIAVALAASTFGAGSPDEEGIRD